jgi:DNA-binding NtrC family response regulator
MITTAQARDSMLDLEPNTTEKVMEDFYARLVRCARDGYRVVLHGPSGSGKGFATRYYLSDPLISQAVEEPGRRRVGRERS